MTAPVVVWFKRDLRIRDHGPLRDAARTGRCIALYIYEPDILGGADSSGYHLSFINECLRELSDNLHTLGCPLITRIGDAAEVLDKLHTEVGFSHLFSHQETGNDLTFKRDIRVGRWAKAKEVTWVEHEQQGVVRRLKTRDGWAAQWNKKMSIPIIETPQRIEAVSGIETTGIMAPEHFGLVTRLNWQDAGEKAAHQTLKSFLTERGQNYQFEMSSPLEGERGCSRLSPYLAYGAISMKQTYQVQCTTAQSQNATGRWPKSHWVVSLIIKLRQTPSLEWAFHSAARIGAGNRISKYGGFGQWPSRK